MSSPFKAAVEAKAPDAMAAVLRPDVVFRSPAVYKPYQGREAALGVLRLVVEVFEDFRYTGQLRAGDEEVLRFSARVGDRELEGSTWCATTTPDSSAS